MQRLISALLKPYKSAAAIFAIVTILYLPGQLFAQNQAFKIETDAAKGTKNLIDTSSGKILFKNCIAIEGLVLNEADPDYYLVVDDKTFQLFHTATKTALVRENIKDPASCYELKKKPAPGKQIIVVYTQDGRRSYLLGTSGILFPRNAQTAIDDFSAIDKTDSYLSTWTSNSEGEYLQGVVDWEGKVVIPEDNFKIVEYDAVNQLFVITVNKLYGTVGQPGATNIPLEYSYLSSCDGFYIAEKYGQVGVITPSKTILPFKFTRNASYGHKNYYNNGSFLLQFEHDDIVIDTSAISLQKINDYLLTYKSGEYYMSKCQTVYADRKFADEEVVAHIVNNETQQITVPSTYHIGTEHVPHLLSGGVGVLKDGKIGMINIETGEIMLPLEYDPEFLKDLFPGERYLDLTFRLRWFKRDRKGIDDDPVLLIMKKNGKFGIIDVKGNIKVPFEYEEITITKDCSEKDLIAIKKDGLYGLIDKNTFVLKVECQYQVLRDCRWAKTYVTDKDLIDLKIKD